MAGSETSRPTHRWLKLLALALLIALLNWGGGWLAHVINIQIYPRHEPAMHLIILCSFALFTLLMALPFMPGIEIGLALMMFLGGKGVFLVYLCTLLALSLSYLIGRKIPPTRIAGLLNWLGLHRARDLVRQLAPLDAGERLALLSARAPSRLAPFLIRHRYLVIAVLLNLPGNALIGGGGGLGLIAGMSGILRYPRYLLLLAFAVAPVPVVIYTKGLL
jgi:hypothetical protein